MARNFLARSRHGTIDYFRRRVPDDLLATVEQPFLIRSLGTGERSQAIILARAYAAQTDIAFTQLRNLFDKKLTAHRTAQWRCNGSERGRGGSIHWAMISPGVPSRHIKCCVLQWSDLHAWISEGIWVYYCFHRKLG